jgi:hypothetical protein
MISFNPPIAGYQKIIVTSLSITVAARIKNTVRSSTLVRTAFLAAGRIGRLLENSSI